MIDKCVSCIQLDRRITDEQDMVDKCVSRIQLDRSITDDQ